MRKRDIIKHINDKEVDDIIKPEDKTVEFMQLWCMIYNEVVRNWDNVVDKA